MRFAVETWAPEFGAASDGTGLDQSDATVDISVEVQPGRWAPLDPPGTTPAASVLFVDGVQRVDARIWITSNGTPPNPPPNGAASDAPRGQDRQSSPDLPPNGATGDAPRGQDRQSSLNLPPKLGAEAEGRGQVRADGAGLSRLGVCASWAAGAVRCAGSVAQVVAVDVRRGVLCPGDDLAPIVTRHGTYQPRPLASSSQSDAGSSGGDPMQEALGQARGDLESRVAIEVASAAAADLVVVDGPLGDRRHIPGAIGYIKAHHVSYLPAAQQNVVAALGPGQRTPLFRIGERRFRYAWYLRLPGPMTHRSAGIVRCEAAGELMVTEAAALANLATVTLPRFATRPHQDPRAPQNLHPIAGLERQLRHRLGDSALLERALRRAAHAAS